MTGWIQHPDLSSDDLGGLSKSQAVEQFEDHDWATELTWLQALRVGSSDWCQPGMGFVDPSGRILHLCPLPNVRLMVHYHFPASKGLGRWLGGRDTRTVMDVPRSLAGELIGKFYHKRPDEFMAQISKLQG